MEVANMAEDSHSEIVLKWTELSTVLETSKQTYVDIVAIPAIGADPERTWTDHNTSESWLISKTRKKLGDTRLMLFDYGILDDHDDVDSLAKRLLDCLREKRRHGSMRRPILLICHSTGGLVAKAALVKDSKSPRPTILPNCHGIAFLATPHQGSTYLWAPEFSKSVRRLMQLRQYIPVRLRNQFKPRNQWLWNLSNQFRSISEDMKVWTFLETSDSTLRMMDEDNNTKLEIRVPITSIRSGLLDLEHEKEIPLATDHMGTPLFKGQESTTRRHFMRDLRLTVSKALELSFRSFDSLDVEHQVKVQVNGFFEDTARGVSDETPLKLWSTTVPLDEYLRSGPAACLQERLRRIPSSLDDSSVSSIDGRPSSSMGGSLHGGTSEHSRSQSPDCHLPVRPSVRRSRSSIGHIPPTILITEPTEQDRTQSGVLDQDPWALPSISSRRSSTEQVSPPQRASLERMASCPIQGSTGLKEDGNSIGQDPRLTSDSRTPTRMPPTIPTNYPRRAPSHERFTTAISSRYKGFLPIPPSAFEQSEDASTEIPRTVPHFDRPDPGTEKLLWIHVPYTHTGWVPDILSKASIDSQGEDISDQLVSGDNWYLNLVRARHLEPHARFVRPGCIYAKQGEETQPSTSSTVGDTQLALYIPYLHWDTYLNLVKRRKAIEKRLEQGRSIPVPAEISKSSLEAKLIWRYLSCEPPIHLRRTLDQFGYPNLKSTVARDDDQMLWKRTRKLIDLNAEVDDTSRSNKSNKSVKSIQSMKSQAKSQQTRNEFVDGKVLMVDQLWLWIVDQKTVVTFFPSQEANTSEEKLYEQSNLHSSIYNEVNGDLARRFETAGDLAALIALHAVTVLFDRTLHHDLQVLQIFEESISILTEWVTKSFKRFRSQGFMTKPTEYNKNPDGRIMPKEERDERDRRSAEENREDLSTLLELRDIIDELGTISKLLDQQTTTIQSMNDYYEEQSRGKIFIKMSLSRLEEYRVQVAEMREDAQTAQKAVENLLDVKQKQANVDESRMARWQAEVTQDQSRAVMVFTVFTVIFLPLSFFTSLFGINVREWSGEPDNLTIAEMLEIAGPTSFAIIVTALLLAFSERLRECLVGLYKLSVIVSWEVIGQPIKALLHLSVPDPDDDTTAGSGRNKLNTREQATSSTGARIRSRAGYGYGQSNRSLDPDIWTRHGDRMRQPLPSETESDSESR